MRHSAEQKKKHQTAYREEKNPLKARTIGTQNLIIQIMESPKGNKHKK